MMCKLKPQMDKEGHYDVQIEGGCKRGHYDVQIRWKSGQYEVLIKRVDR